MSTSTQTETLTAECPECAANVNFDRAPLLGEVIGCGDCGAELEVVNRAPVTLEVAPNVEEDWGE